MEAGILLCDICGHVFKHRKYLLHHVRTIHDTQRMSEARNHSKCGQSSRNFSCKSNLTKHVKRVHRERLFECDNTTLPSVGRRAWPFTLKGKAVTVTGRGGAGSNLSVRKTRAIWWNWWNLTTTMLYRLSRNTCLTYAGRDLNSWASCVHYRDKHADTCMRDANKATPMSSCLTYLTSWSTGVTSARLRMKRA